MHAYRAALLSFADDGSARLEEDGLLVVGPDAAGRQVVRAAGPHAQLASNCPGVSATPIGRQPSNGHCRTVVICEASWLKVPLSRKRTVSSCAPAGSG